MKDSKVFSVVIPAYGGENVWKTAVDSVLAQDYPEIELIYTDDCTPGFDAECVHAYIQANKRANLVRFEVIHHAQNMGTVRNFCAAHTRCMGRYLAHLAMDDAYCDPGVLTRFAHALEQKSPDVLGVYARSLVCDELLTPLGRVSFDIQMAERMNDMDAKAQFGQIALGCCIHMGASAFVREEFMAHGGFDTDYRLIEDWPFFLAAVCRGSRFVYMPFDAILYRSGGVTDAGFTSPVKRVCCEDHVRLYEKRILPYLKMLPAAQRSAVYGKYVKDRMDMEQIYGKLSTLRFREKMHYLIRYFPTHISICFQRRKKLYVLWIAGVGILLLMGSAAGACLYSVFAAALLFVKRQNLRELNKGHRRKSCD